jgi:hypothetical protein
LIFALRGTTQSSLQQAYHAVTALHTHYKHTNKHTTNAGLETAYAICSEAGRVLKPGGHFVMVSHLGPDSDAGMDLLQDSILKGLKQGSVQQACAPCDSTAAASDEQGYLWTVGVHCAAHDDDAEGSSNGDDNGGSSGDSSGSPHVYIVKKGLRKPTRAAARGEARSDTVITLHEY